MKPETLQLKNFLDWSKKGIHKKANAVSKIVVAAKSYNEYKYVLLNRRHSMNRIQSKDHRIEAYEINKILWSCFVDKIYIQNNGYDGLALGYQS